MTIEDLREYQSYYYGLNRILLTTIGLWPRQETKQQFFLNIIINLLFFSGLLLEILELQDLGLSLETIIDHLRLSVPAVCTLVCYNVGAFNNKIMAELYYRVECDVISMEDKHELTMFRKYCDLSRKTTWTLAILMYAYYVLMILPPIFYATLSFNNAFNETKIILPLPLKNFVNTKMSYYGMLLYQMVVTFVAVTVMAATYASFVALIQHACFLLGLVTLKINAPFMEDSYDYRFRYFDASYNEYDWITDIIKCYVAAVEFAKLINTLSEKAYLVEIIAATLILVLCFLYLSNIFLSEQKSIEEIMKCAIYIGTIIFLVYINCYIGQMLINHNTTISRELRQISFYTISTKTQKLLPLIILRCTKPCMITIGGMFVSSHEFFSALLQNAISYAMVCHTMR